jgi:predicted nucleic acid-binding protein
MLVFDALLAATALRHNLTLVTRNIADVAETGVAVLDRWGRGDGSTSVMATRTDW